MPTRPMLAARIVPETETIKRTEKSLKMHVNQLRFPVYGTPKIDGIRAIISLNEARTRTFKAIPNRHIQQALKVLPDGLDGELVISFSSFNDTQSAVMSVEGQPDFKFRVFDYCPFGLEALPFVNRWNMLERLGGFPNYVELLNQKLLNSLPELEQYETWCLEQGHEGACVRSPMGFYKSGRSTTTEQFLLKLKRFREAEAEVIGWVELQHNTNTAEQNELGLTKRPKLQVGMVAGNQLGAFVVRDLTTGVEFEIGSGFTHSDRINYWTDRNSLKGRVVTYKYQPYGTKDRPRCPVFRGFRLDI